MNQQPTHLRQISSGRLFPFSVVLAKRSDMRSVIIEGGEEKIFTKAAESKESHKIPHDQQEQFIALQKQLDDLERRHSELVDLFEKISGGKEFLDNREPISPIPAPSATVANTTGVPSAPGVPLSAASPAPGAVTTPSNELPPVTPPANTQSTDGTSVGSSTVSTPASGTLDPAALEQAQAAVQKAEDKVKSQQNYFDEQTKRLSDAQELLADANDSLETADDSNRDSVLLDVEAATKEEKAAGIKVKSATTKLENATKSLAEAKVELEKLTASS